MTQSLQVTDVQGDVLWWRRTVPILACGEVEASKAWKVALPAMARGIHRQGKVIVMFQEGDTVPEKESLLPPLEIFFAGFIDENRKLSGGGEAFCSKDPTSEEPTRSHDIRGIEEFSCQGGELFVCGAGSCQPFRDKVQQGVKFLGRKRHRIRFQIIKNAQRDAFRGRWRDMTWRT